jgi:hypothetical protein
LKLAAVFILLVLNSAYLAARADASLFYFANVALHAVLGLVLEGPRGSGSACWRWAPSWEPCCW